MSNALALKSLGLLVWILSSCVSSKPEVSPPESSPAEPVASNNTENQSEASTPQEQTLPESQAKPRTWSLWIEAQAFDAFAALGFLQELERQGIRPDKIVGSGFACYIGLAWALEGNANSAEWQSMKWPDFDLFNSKTLLGKISGKDGIEDQFKKELSRLFPAREFSDLKAPADCPVFNRQMGFRMHSSQRAKLNLADTLWIQLQTPLLFRSEPEFLRNESWMSGVVGSLPSALELDFMSREDSTGWIILRSATGAERAGTGVWNQALASRFDGIRSYSGLTPAGRTFVSVELFDSRRQPTDTLKPQMRRAYLLDGRRRAQSYLQSNEAKNFLSPALPK
jgi:hypothetical protein